MLFNRVFAMASRDTFSIPPIADFVGRYLRASTVSIDPFARNKRWATYTNDIDPTTAAEYHLSAEEFALELQRQHVKADLLLFDPPFSPRQIKEVYNSIGLHLSSVDTQLSHMLSLTRNSLLPCLTDHAVVLSFGWNSQGMGTGRGFACCEVLLVTHGANHNDTICMAERRIQPTLFDMKEINPHAQP